MAEEIGRDDKPESPVTTSVLPPLFSQVPFAGETVKMAHSIHLHLQSILLLQQLVP